MDILNTPYKEDWFYEFLVYIHCDFDSSLLSLRQKVNMIGKTKHDNKVWANNSMIIMMSFYNLHVNAMQSCE